MKTFMFTVILLTTVTLQAQIAPPGQSSPGNDDPPQTVLRTINGSSDTTDNEFVTLQTEVICFSGVCTYQQQPVNAQLYPNPTINFVNLQFGEDVQGVYIIEVFNTLGQMLSAEQFTAQPNSRTAVSMENYPDGLYFITVRKTDGSETSTFRVTKNSQE